MNRLRLITVAALLIAAMPLISAQQPGTQAEKLLASAEHKATVDGDLRAAIDEYKKALAAAGGSRALAARALLRMAECHQKLGEAEAQVIYARLVREFSDQNDTVVVARARLSSAGAPARTTNDWSVWAGRDADGFGTISQDGRFITYTDWQNGGNLALRDLTTGQNHRLTSGGSTQFSAISKDGRHVAYEWRQSDAGTTPPRYELRVARLHPSSISESRPLFHNDDVTGAVPFDWSPDGKWIAVGVSRKAGTNQIGLVGVADGSLRVLKSLDWKEPTKIFFSPDGRHIAYDLMATDSRDERHVFVMAVDGSRETVAVAHPSQNVIMGWSPDGGHLLFSSNRSGSFGLWAMPIEHGKPAGTPSLVKADLSSSWSMGLTAAGTMYVWKYASPIYVQVSATDLNGGKVVSTPETFQRFIGSRGRPDWSADGKFLAYQSCNPLGSGPCTLWIRSMESGELRELKVKLGYFFFPRWSPDGRELITRGSDLRGRNNGLYRIDAQTGEAKLVVTPYPGQSLPQWSADGAHVYYRRGSSVIARELASGAEREVVSLPSKRVEEIAVSPDGRRVAYQATEPSVGQDLFLMPIAGGAPRSVLRVTAPERLLNRFDWTSDGAALVVAKQRDDTASNELWLVPVDSSAKPRKLDVNVDNWLIGDGFRFDRAGKQVAFVAAAGQPGLEIRALENFLPARSSGTPAVKR
jgi:Tol biopolymer transport system component